jgi:hypothetical protein
MTQRVLIFLLAMCLPSWGTTYYVLGGGTGTHKGTDWANANCKIPNPLAAGDVVYIGNSGGNLADTTTSCAGEATHTFTGNGTLGNHITIKAATGADHGTGTGWNSSYGVDVTPKITWSNSFVPSNGLKNPFWSFCANYYDIDGAVGNADTSGTYGFYFRSAGDMFGFIKIDSHDCSDASLTDITFKFVEIDGVNADSISGTNAAGGLYWGSPVSTTATVSNLSFTYGFLHDLFAPIVTLGNNLGLILDHDYIYNNFGNTVMHSQGLQAGRASGGTTALNNFTLSNSVMKNIQGTGFLMCLDGTCNKWSIYNNIFYYTSNWDSICEYGDTTATCGVSKLLGDNGPSGNIRSMVVYGNTVANIHLKSGHAGADEEGVIVSIAGSSGVVVQNNLWWNCTSASLRTNTGGTPIVTHDYNAWLNTSIGTTTLASHDFQIGTSPGGIAINPFTNSYSNFTPTSETVDAHLNDGVSLPEPYNLDFAGNPRGNDGTWERGAYEFDTGAATKPNPPNLTVIVQ